eukprot:scaffold20818_cov112-Isochrysis_galbana.AAC.5
MRRREVAPREHTAVLGRSHHQEPKLERHVGRRDLMGRLAGEPRGLLEELARPLHIPAAVGGQSAPVERLRLVTYASRGQEALHAHEAGHVRERRRRRRSGARRLVVLHHRGRRGCRPADPGRQRGPEQAVAGAGGCTTERTPLARAQGCQLVRHAERGGVGASGGDHELVGGNEGIDHTRMERRERQAGAGPVPHNLHLWRQG